MTSILVFSSSMESMRSIAFLTQVAFLAGPEADVSDSLPYMIAFRVASSTASSRLILSFSIQLSFLMDIPPIPSGMFHAASPDSSVANAACRTPPYPNALTKS
jgi:hypothetical protein